MQNNRTTGDEMSRHARRELLREVLFGEIIVHPLLKISWKDTLSGTYVSIIVEYIPKEGRGKVGARSQQTNKCQILNNNRYYNT